MEKFFKWLLFSICTFFIVSCGPDPDPEPEPTPGPEDTIIVAKNLYGAWLLSTSDAVNWISYEFNENARVNAEIAKDGYYGTGTGFYYINGNEISGSYTTERNETKYIDWKVTALKPFEISINIFDESVLVGDAALYRILSEIEVEIGNPITPDYRALFGTDNVSDFKSLDNSIVDIDAASGEIKAKSKGSTFATFTTPHGVAAIKINTKEKIKTLPELIVGTWAYDKPADKEWQRMTFYPDGYLYAEWKLYNGVYDFDENDQTTYTIEDQSVSFVLNSYSGPMNSRLETVSINEFNWTYLTYDGKSYNGQYTVQRLLDSYVLSPDGTNTPDYNSLVGGVSIQGFKSHNEAVATVNANGEIIAKSKGITYIDIITPDGTPVVEVNVDGGPIPVSFEDCIGKGISTVHEVIGKEPFSENETTIVYKNYTAVIDMIEVELDANANVVSYLTVKYNTNVKTSQVTNILNATFIQDKDKSTDSYKAYTDASNSDEARIGVAWDIANLTLMYENLDIDLFTNYSDLVGMTKTSAIKRMGRKADVTDEQSQNWFFYDNKGVKIVSAYYTDFVNIYNNVRSVVTMFDDTLSEEQITKYLKKKYFYYPEYSTNEELVFIPDGHALEIFYHPKEKLIMYISTSSSTRHQSHDEVKELAKKAMSISK